MFTESYPIACDYVFLGLSRGELLLDYYYYYYVLLALFGDGVRDLSYGRG